PSRRGPLRRRLGPATRPAADLGASTPPVLLLALPGREIRRPQRIPRRGRLRSGLGRRGGGGVGRPSGGPFRALPHALRQPRVVLAEHPGVPASGAQRVARRGVHRSARLPRLPPIRGPVPERASGPPPP